MTFTSTKDSPLMPALHKAKLIAHICRESVCSCDGFRTSQVIQKCTHSIRSLLQRLSLEVKGSSLGRAISADTDNIDYSYCSFIFILALIGTGGSLLPTVVSDVNCASRKVESPEEISSWDFTSSEHLCHPLIAKSVHGLKIISDCLTHPGPQYKIIMIAKIV